jgi:hypothetical protein
MNPIGFGQTFSQLQANKHLHWWRIGARVAGAMKKQTLRAEEA